MATHDVDLAVGERIVRPGVYWMIHAGDGHVHGSGAAGAAKPANPGLLCGDVVPSGGGS